jgi:GTPase Era involved in 16S rRNA processing
MIYIKGTVYTNDERYKRMIIGSGARGIREIGQSVRKELEQVMEKKVYIELTVDVDPHWMQRFE